MVCALVSRVAVDLGAAVSDAAERIRAALRTRPEYHFTQNREAEAALDELVAENERLQREAEAWEKHGQEETFARERAEARCARHCSHERAGRQRQGSAPPTRERGVVSTAETRLRRGPVPMPDFEEMTFAQLRRVGKCAHLLVCAFDSGRRDPENNARITNFERRVDLLREALTDE